MPNFNLYNFSYSHVIVHWSKHNYLICKLQRWNWTLMFEHMKSVLRDCTHHNYGHAYSATVTIQCVSKKFTLLKSQQLKFTKYFQEIFIPWIALGFFVQMIPNNLIFHAWVSRRHFCVWEQKNPVLTGFWFFYFFIVPCVSLTGSRPCAVNMPGDCLRTFVLLCWPPSYKSINYRTHQK